MSFTSQPPVTVTTETVAGLTPSTSYDFEVQATNAVGNSAQSTIVTAITPAAPTAPSIPTGVATSAIGITTVNLIWNASTGTAPITYQVQVSATGANTWSNGPAVTVTNAQVTGLTASTGYDFRVIASNSVGTSQPSVVLSDIVTGSATPTVTWQIASPTSMTLSNSNLTATAGGSATAYSTRQGAISSTANSTGSYWFDVTLTGISQNTGIGLAGANFVLNSTDAGGDANSIGYYMSTGPGSQQAQTVYFNNAQVLTPSGNAPAADTATATFTFLVNIDTSTGNGTFFVTGPAMRAAYGTSAYNDSATANPATNTGGIPFTIPGNLSILLEAAEAGCITTLNAGSSAPSRVIPSQYLAWNGAVVAAAAPTAPTGLTLGTVASTTVDLSWTAPATGSQPITYTVQQSPAGAGTWTNSSLATASTSGTVTGLTASTAYDLRVVASNAAGTSSPSGTVTTTTLAPSLLPGAPSGVSATALSSSVITVTWQPPTTGGAVGGTSGGYTVLFRKTGTSTFTALPIERIIFPANGSFVEGGITWAVNTTGQITLNGVWDGVSAGVTILADIAGTIWQFVPDPTKGWYSSAPVNPPSYAGPTAVAPYTIQVTGLATSTSYDFEVRASNPAGNGPVSSPIVSAKTTAVIVNTGFRVTNGRIVDSNGNTFVSRGINVLDGLMQNVTPAKIVSRFPRCNCIRLAIGSGNSYPSGFNQPNESFTTVTNWISAAIALGLVVIVDDHEQTGNSPMYSGAALTNDLAYAKLVGQTFANAPNVWIQNMNEPGFFNQIEIYHNAFYTNFRQGGSSSIVLHDVPGGFYTSFVMSLDNTPYKTQVNIGYDLHAYTNFTGGSTNQSAVNTLFNNTVAGVQTWVKCSDGVTPNSQLIPVWWGECGWLNYNGDYNVDSGGADGTNQVINAALNTTVLQSGLSSGGAIWYLCSDGLDPTGTFQPYSGWPNAATGMMQSDYATYTEHGTYWNSIA